MKKKENKLIEECIKEKENDPVSNANKKILIQEETKVFFGEIHLKEIE